MGEVKFKIGDVVWWAHWQVDEGFKEVCCPECLGKRTLLVTLGDGSTVNISCSCCEYGYRGSVGFWELRTFTPVVKQATINRVEEGSNGVMYGIEDTYSTNQVFLKREDAEKRAGELVAEQEKITLSQLMRKKKQEKSWAWNVRYHRREIRELEKSIEYHKLKLGYAIQKSKEEK